MPSSETGEHVREGSEIADEPRSKRFRFKRKQERADTEDSSSRRHHHRHHHRSKRRRTDTHVVDDPSTYDDSASNLPPDTAFRESLFDAMGDDEGAAFWEGVYGQPIHTYPNRFTNEETGELEEMNDEQYAQYVRRKMWEKSYEGIEAAREEQRRKREQEKNRIRMEERSKSRQRETNNHDFVFDIEFERSLERGQRRRDKKRWRTLWEDYLRRWNELLALHESYRKNPADVQELHLRNKIAWPVESGKRRDLDPVKVDEFVRNCTESFDDGRDLLATLKAERIRWHPDKIQQRYGFMEIDEGTMQGVTATFQIFDKLWNDSRMQSS